MKEKEKQLREAFNVEATKARLEGRHTQLCELFRVMTKELKENRQKSWMDVINKGEAV